jgi:hypothetical protein
VHDNAEVNFTVNSRPCVAYQSCTNISCGLIVLVYIVNVTVTGWLYVVVHHLYGDVCSELNVLAHRSKIYRWYLTSYLVELNILINGCKHQSW